MAADDWTTDEVDGLGWEIKELDMPMRGMLVRGADAQFIQEVRNALPALIAEVRSLRQAMQWIARGHLSDPGAYAQSVARAHGIPVPAKEDDEDDADDNR